MKTWLETLQEEVKAHGLTKMADLLGLSRTLISQVTNNKYPGNIDNVRERVESVLLGETVVCPILGVIPKHVCKAHQLRNAADVGSTPDEIKLYKACRSGCEHSHVSEDEMLRRPMRLPVRNVETDKPAARYDADSVISLLKRQSRSDGGENLSRQSAIYTELLEEELRTLGIKFNRALKGR